MQCIFWLKTMPECYCIHMELGYMLLGSWVIKLPRFSTITSYKAEKTGLIKQTNSIYSVLLYLKCYVFYFPYSAEWKNNSTLILWSFHSKFLLLSRRYKISTLLTTLRNSCDSIVVSTLRCGRKNPGSNPGHSMFFFLSFFLLFSQCTSLHNHLINQFWTGLPKQEDDNILCSMISSHYCTCMYRKAWVSN